MPHLDHTGPTGSGSKTGRKLGKCKKTEQELQSAGKLGKGMGKRRNAGKDKPEPNAKSNSFISKYK